MFGGSRTDAGITVSETTALQVSAVYTCVDLISGGIAGLDLNVYEFLPALDAMGPRGKRIAVEQDLHWLLHDEPNPEMTAFSFMKVLQCHCLLWGNGYAEIERDQANRPIGLWPRDPNRTKPVRLTSPREIGGEMLPAGSMVYITTESSIEGAGPERFIAAADMIHIPGLSLDGRIGKSVIELTRQVMGLALATERFGAKFFANGIRPTGAIEMANTMKKESLDNFKKSLLEAYTGENMLRPMVLESGMKWVQNEVKPNEAQYLETRRHQREEIGAIFHVPTRMLGDSSRTNRATAEQEAIEYVQYTLRPWIKAWQPELKRKLFPKMGRTAGKYFPAFYYQDLLTPDAESRGKLIALLKDRGIANTNDIRENFMDWNPIPGPAGETYWMPVNFMDAAEPTPPAPPPANPAHPAKNGVDKVAEASLQRYTRAYSRLFRDAFERISGRDKIALRDFQKAFGPILTAVSEVIWQERSHGADDEGGLGPEVQQFIGDYLSGMYKRLENSKIDDNLAAAELTRAVKALRVAVYRDIATTEAKQIEVVQ